jgi:hypothetical protein
MVSIIATAGVIVALGFVIELVLFVRFDILSAFIASANLKFVVYAVIGIPLVEETIRVAVLTLAEGRLFDKKNYVTVKTAVLMGISIGCFEFVTKTLGLSSKRPLGMDFVTGINLLTFVSSFPIHVALSSAFFSFRSRRFLKTLALHALINLSVVVFSLVLTWYRLGPMAYTCGMLASITYLSYIIWKNFGERLTVREDTQDRTKAAQSMIP